MELFFQWVELFFLQSVELFHLKVSFIQWVELFFLQCGWDELFFQCGMVELFLQPLELFLLQWLELFSGSVTPARSARPMRFTLVKITADATRD